MSHVQTNISKMLILLFLNNKKPVS